MILDLFITICEGSFLLQRLIDYNLKFIILCYLLFRLRFQDECVFVSFCFEITWMVKYAISTQIDFYMFFPMLAFLHPEHLFALRQYANELLQLLNVFLFVSAWGFARLLVRRVFWSVKNGKICHTTFVFAGVHGGRLQRRQFVRFARRLHASDSVLHPNHLS